MKLLIIHSQPAQQVGQVYPNYGNFYAPTITPTQRGIYPAGQVAHVRNPRWPQPQARPGGQPFQAMPAAGRHQFAGNPRAAATGATPVRPVHPRVPLQPAPSAQRVATGESCTILHLIRLANHLRIMNKKSVASK